MTTTKQYDDLNRLSAIASVGMGPAPSPISFAYQYNNANQRPRVTHLDGSYWVYGYDSMGQVTSGKKYWSDGTPVAGQQFEYAFDDIGDRKSTAAGGDAVGGLLAITDASQGSHFSAYDGNGNVTALVKADGAGLTAQYAYGPFGELLRATGPMAKANPFRFSTKYQDDETDLIYYGYRYYNPSAGRWLNRDPIEEFGGMNLYGISRNDLANHYDRYGLFGPLAEFAVNCIKEIVGALAIDWLKNRGDQVAVCHKVADEVRSGAHIGCQGELVIPSSPFLNNAETKDFAGRVAGCLWSKIKSKGIGKILKGLPEGVEKELLEEALGGGIDSLEDATKITDAMHQIRATCSAKGINVSVFTQITLKLGDKIFNLRTDEKKLGHCNKATADARSIYDLGCGCCEKSPFYLKPKQ